jgi:GLPGLI family protein
MKTITLITALFVSVWSLVAQEGHIVYDIQYESDQPEIQAQIGMLAGSTMEVYFKDNLSKVVASMGSLITTTNITDNDSGESLMLMSGMMGKLAAKSNTKDEKEEEEPEMSVELIDETKEILGYTCKKAILSTEEGIELEYWYTEEIKKPEIKAQGFSDEVPGVALAFTINTPQMKMSYTAKEVATKIKKANKIFDMTIPEGYTEQSMEQLRNMMGGGQ